MRATRPDQRAIGIRTRERRALVPAYPCQLSFAERWPEFPRLALPRRAPRSAYARLPVAAQIVLNLICLSNITPLMERLERILRRLAKAAGPMPNGPVLGTLAGDRGRSSVMRALVRLQKVRRLHVEVDLPGRRRRVVFADGAATGWGETRPGHSPFCNGTKRRSAALAMAETVIRVPATVPVIIAPPEILLRQAYVVPPRVRAADTCQWPMWADGERPNGLYCEAPNAAGKSWCRHHLVAAYEPRQPASHHSRMCYTPRYGGV